MSSAYFVRSLFAAAVLFSVVATLSAEEVPGDATQSGAQIQAEKYEFDPATAVAVGDGNVTITYQDMTLAADHATLNTQTKDVEATGNVIFTYGQVVWQGERLSGNLETREFDFGSATGSIGKWFYRAGEARYFQRDRLVLQDVTFSTCEHLLSEDGKRPHYVVHANRISYKHEQWLKSYGNVLKLGPVPVFYLPFIGVNTREGRGGLSIKAGYDSAWGAYAMFEEKWNIGNGSDTKLNVDFRTANGLALGNETNIQTENSVTRLLMYGLHDNDTPETSPGFNRRFKAEDNRYRLKLYHQYKLIDDELVLRLNLDLLSDVDMLEDWFKREYRANPQPRSYFDLAYEGENFNAALTLRPRVNDHFSVVERLPEFRFGVPRQPLGAGGLYYQSDTTAANLKMKWREFDLPSPNGLELQDYDSLRFDTTHFLYYPLSAGGWELLPRAGLRFTYYSDSSDTPIGIDRLNLLFEADDPDSPTAALPIVNYDDNGGSILRTAGEIGLEVSRKFYRVWQDKESDWLGLDGLRHVVQPYMNYTFAPDPSKDREKLYFFDEVDRLTEQNFVRAGTRQEWQTRRSDQIYTVASLDTYADFHFHDREGHGNWGDFGIEAIFNPAALVSFGSSLTFDMDSGELDRAQLSAAAGDPKRLRTTVSYAYQNDYLTRTLYSMGSTLRDQYAQSWLSRRNQKANYLSVLFDFPLSPKMTGKIHYGFDFADGGLAVQSYEIVRDLHCWVGSLGFEESEGDVLIRLLFYLKAYPERSIRSSL